MSCNCETPAPSQSYIETNENCCPSKFCHDGLLSLPEAHRLNVTGVRSGGRCLQTFPRLREGFLVNDGKGGTIVTNQPQVRIPYLRTLLYDGSGQPIMAESGNPEEDDPPGVDSLVVSGACGLQWRYRGRAGYRQILVWDGCKWVTENQGGNDIDDFQSVYDGREDCNYFPMALIRQPDGTYDIGYRVTHYRFPGEIIAYAGPLGNIPADCLACDGQSFDPEEYTKLFAAIGYRWGNDAGMFRVPDLRGQFLRGVDHGAGEDTDSGGRTAKYSGGNTGNNVGSYQQDAFQCHEHDLPIEVAASAGPDEGIDSNSARDLAAAESLLTTGVVESDCDVPRVADETRPKNAYVEYIIYAGCKE